MFVLIVLLGLDAMKSIINHYNASMVITHLQDQWLVLSVHLDINVQMLKHLQFVPKANGHPKVQLSVLNVQPATNVIMLEVTVKH